MKIKDIEIQNFKGLKSVELQDCKHINAIIGKNNSGKSSILHALDMVGLALSLRQWNLFQPKLEIKDLFADTGEFSIRLTYEDESVLEIKANPESGYYNPIFNPQEPSEEQRYKSVLILPDVGLGMLRRQHRTPLYIIEQVESRNYSEVNALEILYAIKFYANRSERGLSPASYEVIIEEIKNYFPDIDDLTSDRTEQDIATLMYTEHGRRLDVLYSGTGLKHFLDVLLKTTISGAKVILLDEPEMGLHPDLQRRFIEYLHKLSEEKGVQFFLATHSQVLLNYADIINYYRITNSRGKREVFHVSDDAIHTLLNDLGLRPSDVFNQDICLLVEGATEIVFFEHIIRVLYKEEFKNISLGILQYGGGAAEAIVSGSIDISNITSAQKYTLWVRDRDTSPSEPHPSPNSTKFINALQSKGLEALILKKREIEYYFPDQILVDAQQGDSTKERIVLEIKKGDQCKKFRKAAEPDAVCVPNGKYLRELLKTHLKDKEQLDMELRDIIKKLIEWKSIISGV